MWFLSGVRWLVYTLFPARCTECGALMSPVLHRTAEELGVKIHAQDPRAAVRSDWLCCEQCPYAVSFDLLAEEEA